MFDGLSLCMVFAANYLGFALLALSLDRHWLQVAGARAERGGRVWRRTLGYGCLATGFAVALGRDGAGFGCLLWVMFLSVGAVAVAFTLAWRPRWLKPLAVSIPLPVAGENAELIPRSSYDR